MPTQLEETLVWLLGEKAVPSLHSTMQMSVRAAVIFFAALVIVRLGHKRFLAKFSAFDVILAFMLGSTFSRAINGKAEFFETIIAGFLLVGLHWLLSILSYRFHVISKVFKGKPNKLVENGVIQWDAMQRSRISEGDLLEALRIHGKIEDVRGVKLALLERNGDISIIPAKGDSEKSEDGPSEQQSSTGASG